MYSDPFFSDCVWNNTFFFFFFSGTYMRTTSTCQEPQCVPCRSSEYQDKYTKEDKCIKQPYCDASKTWWQTKEKKTLIDTDTFIDVARRTTLSILFTDLHFQAPVNVRTKKSICLCKEGFHCSTTECTTCVPHKTCEPGFGVQSKGTKDLFKEVFLQNDSLFLHCAKSNLTITHLF